jgi:D-tyrosyl-tRNA(Tyr) deacylase
MRAVVQRVERAEVRVEEKVTGGIKNGLVVLLGVHRKDSDKDALFLAEKIVHLRIFEDEQGLMNRSLLEVGGNMLVVSQFTLFGDCRKGRRPSYSEAARPELADQLYRKFIQAVQQTGVEVATGEFQKMMDVELINQGPVTLLLDSKKLF